MLHCAGKERSRHPTFQRIMAAGCDGQLASALVFAQGSINDVQRGKGILPTRRQAALPYGGPRQALRLRSKSAVRFHDVRNLGNLYDGRLPCSSPNVARSGISVVRAGCELDGRNAW